MKNISDLKDERGKDVTKQETANQEQEPLDTTEELMQEVLVEFRDSYDDEITAKL